ncbi:hypothetical protein ACFLT9_01585 [Acidobacteriota bacterium]
MKYSVSAVLILCLFLPLNSQDLLDIPKVSREEKICFSLYTVHNGILKLTAQLYPLHSGDRFEVFLDIKKDGDWERISRADVQYPGYAATFRVKNWNHSKDTEYRVSHMDRAFYEGIIRKDPVDKDEIVVAAFTGNSIYPGHGGDIPRNDIVDNLKKINPDLLFFSGDQVYDHFRHLAYWLKFGRDFGEIIKDTPTVCIPDDHDVGQANLWGAGGKQSKSGAGPDGGYYMPVEYVKEVERAQTSHLPDPFDPTPIERDIGVYYTSLTLGRISFAIIEDRKFKTGPEGVVPPMGPRPDHVTNPDYDPQALDVEGAVLLGERQLKFLNEWTSDWFDCDMKAVLSQTIFCGGAHIHGKVGGRLFVDMDSNGWPQSGRNKALYAMRKGFALHIAGDQHLGTIFHHGIDEWNDAGYSFCVPSIANLYLRWWKPLEPGKNRQPGYPDYSGEFLDGLGNKITLWAAANPSEEPNGGNKLTTRAAGFGVVRFNKKNRQITMECWPRNVDITAEGAKQYAGWPKTISQEDNYARKPAAYLPTLSISGAVDPIVQIIDESSGEIEYTVRIKGATFRPKVFQSGSYTIRIFDSEFDKKITRVKSIGLDETKKLDVKITK